MRFSSIPIHSSPRTLLNRPIEAAKQGPSASYSKQLLPKQSPSSDSPEFRARRILLALALLAAIFQTPPSPAQTQSAYKVGIAQRAFLHGDKSYDWRDAKIHALLTTIWYPATWSARQILYQEG